jgi:hypothetical protein
MKKRYMLLMLLFALAGALLIGCGSSAPIAANPSPSPEAEPTPVTEPTPDPVETPEPRPIATDLDLAREALIGYFAALNEGRYADAVELFGGSLEYPISVNPDTDPGDPAALLEAACTRQLQCLRVLNIAEEEAVSDSEFRFLVEFQTATGELFVLGPCCGATEAEMPPMSQFPYTVIKDGDAFVVQELPVYVP